MSPCILADVGIAKLSEPLRDYNTAFPRPARSCWKAAILARLTKTRERRADRQPGDRRVLEPVRDDSV